MARRLTARELNRALLGRQLLLRRARLSLPKALERMGGLQAQYAPSMYIGLWSRLHGFERSALTRALERRTVVQASLLRSTIHLVSARDYWPWAVAIRTSRREHDEVERVTWLDLQPAGAAAAGRVGRVERLDEHALVAGGQRRVEEGLRAAGIVDQRARHARRGRHQLVERRGAL